MSSARRPVASDFFSDPPTERPVDSKSSHSASTAFLPSKNSFIPHQDSLHAQDLAIKFNASPTYQELDNSNMTSQAPEGSAPAPQSPDLLSALAAFVNDNGQSAPPAAPASKSTSDPFDAIFGGSYHNKPKPIISIPLPAPTAPASSFSATGKKPGSLFAGLKIKKNRAVSPLIDAPKGPKGWVEGQAEAAEDSGYIDAPLETPALTTGSSTSSRDGSPLSAVASVEREVSPAIPRLQPMPRIGDIFSSREDFEQTCIRIADVQGCRVRVFRSVLRGAGQFVTLKCDSLPCKRDLTISAKPTKSQWKVTDKTDLAPPIIPEPPKSTQTIPDPPKPTHQSDKDIDIDRKPVVKPPAATTSNYGGMPAVGDTFKTRDAFERKARQAAYDQDCSLRVVASLINPGPGQKANALLKCNRSPCSLKVRVEQVDGTWTVTSREDRDVSVPHGAARRPRKKKSSNGLLPVTSTSNSSSARKTRKRENEDDLYSDDMSMSEDEKAGEDLYQDEEEEDDVPLARTQSQTAPAKNVPASAPPPIANSSSIDSMPSIGDTFPTRAALEDRVRKVGEKQGCLIRIPNSGNTVGKGHHKPYVHFKCGKELCDLVINARLQGHLWTVIAQHDYTPSAHGTISNSLQQNVSVPAASSSSARSSISAIMPSVGDTFPTRAAFEEQTKKAGDQQGCQLRVFCSKNAVGKDGQKPFVDLACNKEGCEQVIKARLEGGLWIVKKRQDRASSGVHGQTTKWPKGSHKVTKTEDDLSDSDLSMLSEDEADEDAPYENEEENEDEDDVPLPPAQESYLHAPKRSSTGQSVPRRSPSVAAESAVARGSLSLPGVRWRVSGESTSISANQIGLKSRYTSTEALVEAAESFTGYNTSSSYTSAGHLRLECKAKKSDYPECGFLVVAAFLPQDQSWEIVQFQSKHDHSSKRSVSVGATAESKKRKSDGYVPRASSSRMAPIADGPKGRIDWESERLEQLTRGLKAKMEPKEETMDEQKPFNRTHIPVTAYDYHRLDMDALVGRSSEKTDTQDDAEYEWPVKRARKISNTVPEGVSKRGRPRKAPPPGSAKAEDALHETVSRRRTPSSGSSHHSITPMAIDEVDPSEKKDNFCVLVPSPKIKRDRTHSASPKTVAIEDSPMITAASLPATPIVPVATQLTYEAPAPSKAPALAPNVASTSQLAGPIQMRQSKVGRDLRKLLNGLGEGLGEGPADALIAAGLNDCNRLRQLNPVSWPAFCDIVLKKNPQINEFDGFMLKDCVLQYLNARKK